MVTCTCPGWWFKHPRALHHPECEIVDPVRYRVMRWDVSAKRWYAITGYDPSYTAAAVLAINAQAHNYRVDYHLEREGDDLNASGVRPSR